MNIVIAGLKQIEHKNGSQNWSYERRIWIMASGPAGISKKEGW